MSRAVQEGCISSCCSFNDRFSSFVPQMKSSNLSPIWICTQTVGSIILCKFIHCISIGYFYLCEGRVLGCDT